MKKSLTNPALKSLEILIGRWEIELTNASFLQNKSDKLNGSATFDLIEKEGFLVMRQGDAPLPWTRWVISRDELEQNYLVAYYDDRGVSRQYEMSFNNGIWKIWREAPGFWQRFEGKISKDGNTITAHWEKSTDNGKNWEYDFDLNYKRAASVIEGSSLHRHEESMRPCV